MSKQALGEADSASENSSTDFRVVSESVGSTRRKGVSYVNSSPLRSNWILVHAYSLNKLFLLHPANPTPQNPTLPPTTESLFAKNRHLGLPVRPVVCSILRGIETCDHRDIILVRSLFVRDHPSYRDMRYLRMLNEWWNLDPQSIYPTCQLRFEGAYRRSLPRLY